MTSPALAARPVPHVVEHPPVGHPGEPEEPGGYRPGVHVHPYTGVGNTGGGDLSGDAVAVILIFTVVIVAIAIAVAVSRQNTESV